MTGHLSQLLRESAHYADARRQVVESCVVSGVCRTDPRYDLLRCFHEAEAAVEPPESIYVRVRLEALREAA